MNKTFSYKWIFVSVLAFSLSCFELLFSHYMLPSEKKVIISVCSLVTFCFISTALFKVIKEKVSIKNLFLIIILSIIASLYFIKVLWFSGYLCLNPYNVLFEGNFHADTLSHSALSESIISNGYPSLLFNTKNMFNYHFGSHYIMAFISKILRIHAFSAYNWIYPVIFLPLFFLTLFSAIESFMKKGISILEFVFVIFFCFIGFMPNSFMNSIGVWNSSFFVSESFCIGLMCLFLYCRLINKNNYISFRNIILTFVFIFICSSMKISIGILMYVFSCWFTFRTKKIKKSIPVILLLTISLGLACICFNERVGSASKHSLSFLHFYKAYVTKDSIFFHFLIIYWMLVLGLYNRLKNKSMIVELKESTAILEESIIITTIVSILPGCFFYIEGGSAFYFFSVLYPISIIYFISNGNLEYLLSKISSKKIIMSIVLAVFIGTISLNCIIALKKISQNRPSLHGSIDKVLESNLFKFMEDLRNQDRKTSAVILDANSELFELYKGKDKRSLSYFIQSYTGLPVYGMYERKNGKIYLLNGEYIQDDIKPLFFGLDYDEVFLDEDTEEKIRRDGISNIVYSKSLID